MGICKSLMTILAHQDDEALFCGSLLFRLRGIVKMHLVCVFEPRPKKKQTATRDQHFKDLCAFLGAEPVLLQRPISDKAHDSEFLNDAASLLQRIMITRPVDLCITHNKNGEYGHRNHRMLHQLMLPIIQHFPHTEFWCLGHKAKPPYVHIEPNHPKGKKRMLDFYLPEWAPEKHGFKFAYEPEKFILWKEGNPGVRLPNARAENDSEESSAMGP